MKRSIAFLTSILLFVFCFSLNVLAQEQTGNIEGTVKDPNGAVVPSVTVTVRSATGAGQVNPTATGTGFRREVVTDSEGFFRVLQVPPGVYTVTTAATSGFGSATYENVTVVLGKNTQLDITVQPGTGQNVVDVLVSDATAIILDFHDHEIVDPLRPDRDHPRAAGCVDRVVDHVRPDLV